jgi:hypothetical protein
MNALFSGRKVLVSLACFIAAVIVVNGGWIGAGAVAAVARGATIPDMLFSYDPGELAGMFAALGDEGRAAYLAMNAFDFLFAAVYGVFYFFALGWIATRLFPSRPGLRLIAAFGFSGALFDEIENAIFRFAASGEGSVAGWPASIAAFSSTAKYCLIAATMVAVVGGLVAVAADALIRRKGREA